MQTVRVKLGRELAIQSRSQFLALAHDAAGDASGDSDLDMITDIRSEETKKGATYVALFVYSHFGSVLVTYEGAER